MKTIAQLLQLTKNPYYTFSDAERKVLDSFLAKQSAQRDQRKRSSTSSSKKTPAIVHSKNQVVKDTGVVPTEEQTAAAQELAEKPATSKDPR